MKSLSEHRLNLHRAGVGHNQQPNWQRHDLVDRSHRCLQATTAREPIVGVVTLNASMLIPFAIGLIEVAFDRDREHPTIYD
jgi:hypothetical protein